MNAEMSNTWSYEPDIDLVIAELLVASEPINRPSVESILAGTAIPEYDWEHLAYLGFTDPLLARQVRSILQMAQHLVEGDISPEGVAPSLIAVGKIIARGLASAVTTEVG
jgi:hypothetical protein